MVLFLYLFFSFLHTYAFIKVYKNNKAESIIPKILWSLAAMSFKMQLMVVLLLAAVSGSQGINFNIDW